MGEHRIVISQELWDACCDPLARAKDEFRWIAYDQLGIPRPKPPTPRDPGIVTFKDWLDSRSS